MYLLDTNVLSELRKLKGDRTDPKFAEWAERADSSTFYVSAVTIQETETGILLLERRDPTQAGILREWFIDHVLPTFADRVLPVDLSVARRSAHIHVPVTHSVRDAYIAATGLVHDMPVVTRNVKDFVGTGVRILNPWQPALVEDSF
jgi:predicted nucleic acid-binding protein